MPQVKGVFGRKSLDDVIPGSWYIIPLPSTREVRGRTSNLLEVSVHVRIFGANVCLSDVLGVKAENFKEF